MSKVSPAPSCIAPALTKPFHHNTSLATSSLPVGLVLAQSSVHLLSASTRPYDTEWRCSFADERW